MGVNVYVLEKVSLVAETNSSSSHCYSIAPRLAEEKHREQLRRIREEIRHVLKKQNWVLLPFRGGETSFGWECARYKDWRNLLNYLLVGEYYATIADYEEYASESAFQLIADLLNEFLGTDKVRIPTYEEIKDWEDTVDVIGVDHQSRDVVEEIIQDLREGRISLEDYLTRYILYTDNDNSPCGNCMG